MYSIMSCFFLNRHARLATSISADCIAVAASLYVALMLRMNGDLPDHMAAGFSDSVPWLMIVGLITFLSMGLYRCIWRLASLAEIILLIQAASAAIAAGFLVLLLAGNLDWLPTSVPVMQWFILISLMAGVRLAPRIVRSARARSRASLPRAADAASGPQQRALIVGRPEDMEVVLRQIETSRDPALRPIGLLDLDGQSAGLRLRNIKILGGTDSIEHVVSRLASRGQRPTCILIAEGDVPLAGPARMRLVTAAQTLNLSVLGAPVPTKVGEALNVDKIDLAELLGRPSAKLDATIPLRAIQNKRVLVTGAGGTIGRELARQIAAIGPAELILLDAGEYNLYLVDLEIRENFRHINCHAMLCSIRQRAHVMEVFDRHRPDFVFHAAALKHVPLVEGNICAAVMTNVIGTRNVADAARAHGAIAMVQVSTDKAVNPVSAMGATKRLGELYCQALDLEGAGRPGSARFMTVRFGNVLGSSGSLIPLFQRQLAQNAPLTVTHPDITRFFMTVHEAVQLVLHSMARGLECGVQRGRIIVLDMGEPVKIIDIAKRMIRLAGLVPDRDVPIKIVGLRPGEKLYEELFDDGEERLPSALPGVFEAEPMPVPIDVLTRSFAQLAAAAHESDEALTRALLFESLEGGRQAALDVKPAHAAATVSILRVPASATAPLQAAL